LRAAAGLSWQGACLTTGVFTGTPGHLKSFDYTGPHRYSLTFCTNQRAQTFVEPSGVEIVLKQVLRAAADQRFEIIAYCFMPDHLHLLVEARTDASNALRFISRAKQLSGYHYKQTFGQVLWQRYGFERVLRNDEQTLVVARYILENPLRRGMAARVEDYPFVGSTLYTVSEILEATQLS
jgi:putative transposase